VSVLGKSGAKNLCKLPIDKFAGVWYNGNLARLGRERAGQKFKMKKGGC